MHLMNIAELYAQEEQVALKQFNHEDAWQLGNLVAGLARENQLPVAISIEINDQVIFQCAFAGTSADNDRWIKGKRKVTKLYQKSSLLVREMIAATGKPIDECMHLNSMEYLAFGGCVPIRLTSHVVAGTLTISGLPDEEDHALAMRGLAAFVELKTAKFQQFYTL